MTKEEILKAITDDKTMPFIQPEQLAGIVDFVIKNYNTSLPSDLDEAAEEYAYNNWEDNDYHTGASEGLCERGGQLYFNTPRTAFAALIDKVSGKGTWQSNPLVFVYEFEIIK